MGFSISIYFINSTNCFKFVLNKLPNTERINEKIVLLINLSVKYLLERTKNSPPDINN